MAERRFRSVGDVIAFAIGREIEAAEGYGGLAAQASTPGLRDLLLELKAEEENHRRLLETMSLGGGGMPAAPAEDMGLSDALADEPLAPDMTFQELLIFAARKEKKAADLYAGLAGKPEAAAYRKVFEFLAGQERTHKAKLEAEYEKHVLTED
ncbi:MAG: ferritin-like domain-containing protein [Candidatus Aminicenantales bacterium]